MRQKVESEKKMRISISIDVDILGIAKVPL